MAGQSIYSIQKIEKRLSALTEEAEHTLSCIRELTAEALTAELPSLQLRLKRLEASFENCVHELKDISDHEGQDTLVGKTCIRMEAAAAGELRWIRDLLEELKVSKNSLSLSETMKKEAFEAKFRSALEGRKDL